MDLAGLAREFNKKMQEVTQEAREAFGKVAEEAQYQVDREVGRFLSQHPELYAEMKKTYRQAKRTLDQLGKDLGWK